MQNNGGRCQQMISFQKFVDSAQKCFALLPQINFPIDNLKWDRIQAIFLNLFYFKWQTRRNRLQVTGQILPFTGHKNKRSSEISYLLRSVQLAI